MLPPCTALRLPPSIVPALISVPIGALIAPIVPPARLVMEAKPLSDEDVASSAKPPVPVMLPELSSDTAAVPYVLPDEAPTVIPLAPVTLAPAATVIVARVPYVS